VCVNGALKAQIDRRFIGAKARALVALLIYLGPLLRGWERIRWRIREMRAQPHVAPAETEQRAHHAGHGSRHEQHEGEKGSNHRHRLRS
jgi:hypothetical protein